jgi:hypothetical protein
VARAIAIASAVLLLAVGLWLWLDGDGAQGPRPLTREERAALILRAAQDAIRAARCERTAGERGASTASVALELEVDPRGRGRASTIEVERPPGSEEEIPPEVGECVAGAVERVAYPRGPAVQLRVQAF